MPRVLGVDIPGNKRVEYALRYIYGIGPARSKVVVEKAKLDPTTRAQNLTDEELRRVIAVLQDNFVLEGDLRRDVAMNIKRLMDLGCYRGLRHRRGLPVRGQQTKTNARTRKGPRRPIKR